MLIIAERTADWIISWHVKEVVAKMSEDLVKVVEDTLRLVDVEALFLAKRTGNYSLSQPGDSPFLVISCRRRAFASATQICRRRV